MSSDAKFYSGLGFVFSVDDKEIIDKLKETSPERVASVTYGDVFELEDFLFDISDRFEISGKDNEFSSVYPDLEVHAVSTINCYAKQFVVCLSESKKLLYSRNDKIDAGAITSDSLESQMKKNLEAFDSFTRDFAIENEPHVVLWCKW